jgi:hypothetical protein
MHLSLLCFLEHSLLFRCHGCHEFLLNYLSLHFGSTFKGYCILFPSIFIDVVLFICIFGYREEEITFTLLHLPFSFFLLLHLPELLHLDFLVSIILLFFNYIIFCMKIFQVFLNFLVPLLVSWN